MKVRVYLRVAKHPRGRQQGAMVKATLDPDQRPLQDNSVNSRILPTCHFALDLDIPEEAFHGAARVVAELSVPPERLEIAAEVAELES